MSMYDAAEYCREVVGAFRAAPKLWSQLKWYRKVLYVLLWCAGLAYSGTTAVYMGLGNGVIAAVISVIAAFLILTMLDLPSLVRFFYKEIRMSVEDAIYRWRYEHVWPEAERISYEEAQATEAKYRGRQS